MKKFFHIVWCGPGTVSKTLDRTSPAVVGACVSHIIIRVSCPDDILLIHVDNRGTSGHGRASDDCALSPALNLGALKSEQEQRSNHVQRVVVDIRELVRR